MGSTLKEIAEYCGVTKQTVKNNLKSMNLWNLHVTEGDHSTPAVVDEEATKQVVACITSKRRPHTEAPQDESLDLVRLYEMRVKDLESTIHGLELERDRLRDQNSEFAKQISVQAETIKALPSPNAVEMARKEGERLGLEAGEANGRDQERQRIADMSFWKRRKYLKGQGS